MFRWMSVKETAALLDVSPQRVRRLLSEGRLPAGKDTETGHWRVAYPFMVRPGKRGPRFRNLSIAQ